MLDRLHKDLTAAFWKAGLTANDGARCEVARRKPGAEDEIAGTHRPWRPLDLHWVRALRVCEQLTLKLRVARERRDIDAQSTATEGKCVANLDRGAGRRGLWEILMPCELELVKIGCVREMNLCLEDLRKPAIVFFKNGLE